ncbi:iron complex outermembrane recepter protein [Gammaproteobacteria bacterium]
MSRAVPSAIWLSPFYVWTLALATPAMAVESAEKLPVVLVAATRLPSQFDAPTGTVTIIDAEEIRNSTAQTIPELLALKAGINTSSYYGIQATKTSIGLRGFGVTDSQNTLILLDGRRLNGIELTSVDFSGLPLEMVERIEITRGGGSVLYGDGASGGVINIITRAGGDTPGTHGQVRLEVGNSDTHRVEANLSHADGPFSLDLTATTTNSDGYRANNNLRQNNFQGDLRRHEAEGEWYLKVGASDEMQRLPGARSVNLAPRGINELQNDRRGTSTPNDYANLNGSYLTLGMTRQISTNVEIFLDAGYRASHQEAFYEQGGFPKYLDTDLKTLSFTPRITLGHTLFGRSATALLGMDWYQYDYTSDRGQTSSTDPIHRMDIQQGTLAFYTQETTRVTTDTALTFGARLQRVSVEAKDTFNSSAPGAVFDNHIPDFSHGDTEHMLELGLRQVLTPNWALTGSFGRSVRFSTVDELLKYDENFLAFLSPLQPQKAVQTNLGLEYQQENGLRITPTLYYMNLRDEIAYDPQTFSNINLDRTRRYGLEVAAHAPLFQTLFMELNYTYARAQFRDGPQSGHDVPLVPRNNTALTTLWDIDHQTRATATVRHVGRKYFDNDQSNSFMARIPAYTTIDTKLTYHQGFLELTAAVYNLLDKQFYDYGVCSNTAPKYNTYPLPGRNFMFSVGLQF